MKGKKEMKKKFFSVMAITAVVCCIMACGNSTSKDENKDSADVKDKKEVVETTQNEEVVQNDETEVGVRGETDSESEGFGRCSASGCYCKAFEGRGQTCGNCGHAYSKHY